MYNNTTNVPPTVDSSSVADDSSATDSSSEATDDSSSTTDDSSEGSEDKGVVVLYEGTETFGDNYAEVDLGLVNMPYAVAGGVITFDYTTEVDSVLTLSVDGKALAKTYLQAKAAKTSISLTLTAETAQTLVNASGLKLKGNKGTITRITYTPPAS